MVNSLGKLRKTRHPFLRLAHVFGDWRYVDTSDGRLAVVGPYYPTLTEALLDGPRYWSECWGWQG